jgi:hypothetical protein
MCAVRRRFRSNGRKLRLATVAAAQCSSRGSRNSERHREVRGASEGQAWLRRWCAREQLPGDIARYVPAESSHPLRAAASPTFHLARNLRRYMGKNWLMREADGSGGEAQKARGRNRITGNLSVQSRPLAPPQHHPRIAIAGDIPPGSCKSPGRQIDYTVASAASSLSRRLAPLKKPAGGGSSIGRGGGLGRGTGIGGGGSVIGGGRDGSGGHTGGVPGGACGVGP